MKMLSPKKYVETKVRNLPVYKCFVNKDWQESKMGDVIVMRKHANGNITAGMFLVDLLCLGVKDTTFLFNENEEEITRKLEPALKLAEQVDYNTAHNIVYAGHDFAMDFDIKPHKDFAITKYILEDDDDSIPLVEIPTGADDGKPYLLTGKPGQYADALLKLKKNAGEGNYYYTTDQHEGDTEDVSEDEADDEFSELLDDYKEEELTPLAAQYIKNEDFEDDAKVNNRSAFEQITIRTEMLYRIYKSLQPEYFYSEDVTDRADVNYLTEAFKTPDIDSEENHAFITATREVADYFQPGNSPANPKEFFESLLLKYEESASVIANFYEYFIYQKEVELIPIAASYLEKLGRTKLLAKLSLALGALIMNVDEPRFEFIYNEADISTAFPGKKTWNPLELGTFWLIQVRVHTKKDDLKNAFHYYELFAETRMQSWLTPFVQFELCEKMKKVIEENLQQNEIENMGEAEDEGKNSLKIVS
jgi:hypothetical protein